MAGKSVLSLSLSKAARRQSHAHLSYVTGSVSRRGDRRVARPSANSPPPRALASTGDPPGAPTRNFPSARLPPLRRRGRAAADNVLGARGGGGRPGGGTGRR